MDQNFSASHRGLLSAVLAAARKWKPPRDSSAYLQAYFANVDAQDLAERNPSDLAALALSHLKFARQRRGRASVRVFNPTVAQDGFASLHTVVQLVTDDMPFLVDSVGMVLSQRGLNTHFLAHPIFAVKRGRDGVLKAITPRPEVAKPAAQRPESFQHLEVDRVVDPAELSSLCSQIESALQDVRLVCGDWGAMRASARAVAADFENPSGRIDPTEADETRTLLGWMENKHFTFMGYREYRLRGRGGRETLVPLEETGLGLLRKGRTRPALVGRISARDIRRQAHSPEIALVTKSNAISTVHRRGYLDYVGIKHFDRKGKLIGERRFLGLWTSAAYSANPRDIPVLRRKVTRVIEHFDLAPDSHDGKALQHIVENFPREELFQAGLEELIRLVTGVFGLQERPRVRILLRRDPFRRFYACLVFVPRDKYNTFVRQRIERVVREALAATSIESQVQIAESNLARVYFVARTLPSGDTQINLPQLERKVEAAVRSWSDTFKDALLANREEAQALQLYGRYANTFPAAYTEDFDAAVAVRDVGFLEALENQPDACLLYTSPSPRD